ncbi:MAG: hypothetical protein E6Q97_00875 [Desulfurellales bacterium]|nr:MAG: hypothetical protein E6Q97_00875 [Desulfurellales bacterium]
MNEELQKAIVEIAKGLQKAGEGAGQFAMDQAPLLAQEIIAWEIVSGIIGAALFGGLTVWALRRMARHVWGDKELDFCDKIIPTLVSFFFITSVAIVSYCNLSQAAKAFVAPRVVLIEKAAELGGITK